MWLVTAGTNFFQPFLSATYSCFSTHMVRNRQPRCYIPIESRIVPMTIRSLSRTVLEALVAVNCQNNRRQALPLLVRPRFLPRDQKGPGARVYRPAERSELSKQQNKRGSRRSKPPVLHQMGSFFRIDPSVKLVTKGSPRPRGS